MSSVMVTTPLVSQRYVVFWRISMSSSAAAKCARTVITRPSDVCLLRTRSTPRVTCSSPQLRQRPSGFSSWFGASLRPSLSVGARQSERTGGVVSRVWPSNRIAVSRPPSVSKSTSVRSPLVFSRGARRLRRVGSATCCQPTGNPFGAQPRSIAVSKYTVRNASSPGAASGFSPAISTVSDSPAAMSGRRSAPCCTISPSIVIS